jgi:E3 ubiquitin-protein ligase Topors
MNVDPVAPKAENDDFVLELDAEVDEDHCSICLQAIVDRALIPGCSHEFCFECLMMWSDQSRRCPLCAQNIGDYLIHHIRSSYDYQKHFLPPLRTSPRPLSRTDGTRIAPVTHRRRERVWGSRDRSARHEADALQRAVSRRRWIYQHDLYAKHVASNKYTRYRPYPTPAQFTASQDLISRMTVFLRRELLVWPNADVEFLVTFVISLVKSIDIRSENAIKLLAEFLDMDTQYVAGERHVNAEHFAHEIYCYLRSPYRDLGVYDSVVQYDTPTGIPPPPSHERTRRWDPGLASRSRSRSQSHNLRASHSHSYPPSSREWNMRPEDSEYDSRRPNSSRRPTKVLNVYDSSGRSRSGTRVKGKGKRRASARSMSPPESGSPVAHERTASPEMLAASMNFPVNTPERNTAASSAGDMHRETSPPQTPESNSGGTPVVSPHGNPGKAHATHDTNNLPSPLDGLRSLNHEIIASSSSNSETPETPTINIDRARANPMRQPRYRSQRDSIIAHLRGSIITPRPTPNLLARMTDQTVAKPNVSGDDADVTKRTGGGRHVDLPTQTAERSSGLSDSDDPSGGSHPKEAAVTKAEAPREAPPPPPPRTSHAYLLGRLYDEKATATEARLRTQARLRARLAAERRLLAQGDGGRGASAAAAGSC